MVEFGEGQGGLPTVLLTHPQTNQKLVVYLYGATIAQWLKTDGAGAGRRGSSRGSAAVQAGAGGKGREAREAGDRVTGRGLWGEAHGTAWTARRE